MTTPVDGMAAAQTLLSWKTCTPGYCLKYVWNAYAANGAYTDGQYYPTAYSAWQQATSGKHPDDWNVPPGMPVYFGPKSSSSAGDVVISTGDGNCVATDWPYGGVIGTTTLKARQSQIGRPYLGWIDNILGYPIKGADMPLDPNVDYPAFSYMLQRAFQYDLRPKGNGATQDYGATMWEQIGGISGQVGAIPTTPTVVDIDYDKLAAALSAQGLTLAIVSPTTPTTSNVETRHDDK